MQSRSEPYLTVKSNSQGSARRATAVALVVAATTLAAFIPALRNGFVNWDDDTLLLNNPDFRGFGPWYLRWMFSTTLLGNYQPVTWLSFAFDYSIWELRPFGYHLTNVILHAVDAAMFYFIARRMLRACNSSARGASIDIAAAAAALLYSVHPLRVESVAWITERKDVLSAFFLFGCLLAWLRSIDAGRARPLLWRVLALALFGLSLLTKVWGITLPIILLILDAYPLGRLSRSTARRLVAEKWPFFLLAAAAAIGALFAQTTNVGSVAKASIAGRFAQAAWGIVFYLGKMLWPIPLSPIYEHPAPYNPFAMQFAVAAASCLLISLGLWFVRRTWPAGIACWAIYLVVLSPVLGFVQVGPQIAADRYTYLAAAPWAILAGAGLLGILQADRRWAVLAPAIAGVAVIGLGVLTWRQTRIWRDSESLWRASLAYNPNSWNGHNGMAGIYFDQKNYPEALKHLEQAYAAVPDYPGVVINLAACLSYLDRTAESAEYLRRAAAIPGLSNAWLLAIANSLNKLGYDDDSRKLYERLLQSDPDDGTAAFTHFRLAHLVGRSGDTTGAIRHFARAVELFEPAIRAGQSDARVFVEAGMYSDACAQLVDLLTATGDLAGAETYRRKRGFVTGS